MHKPNNKHKRGFASMSPERRREIARLGGKAVPPEKRSFSKDRQLATCAGSIGGSNIPDKKRSFKRDPELASRAGKLGGLASKRSKSNA